MEKCFIEVCFLKYRNLIPSFIFILYILRCAYVAAGEVCGMFIFVYLGVKLRYRHCLLKYIPAQHFNIFRFILVDASWVVFDEHFYTECFMTLGHNCRRWFPRSLWSKSSYKHVFDFGRLRSYDRLKLRIEGNDYWQ